MKLNAFFQLSNISKFILSLFIEKSRNYTYRKRIRILNKRVIKKEKRKYTSIVM